MKTNEPKFIEQGDYKLKIVYWYSEWDKRPYYAHTLFYKGKAVNVISCASRELTLKDVVGMWHAKRVGR